MPLSLALHFANITTHTGVSRIFFCLGDVRVNLPELTWSVSYSIVNLLLCYKNNSTSHTHGAINMLFNTIVTDHYGGREGKHGYHLLNSILSKY